MSWPIMLACSFRSVPSGRITLVPTTCLWHTSSCLPESIYHSRTSSRACPYSGTYSHNGLPYLAIPPLESCISQMHPSDASSVHDLDCFQSPDKILNLHEAREYGTYQLFSILTKSSKDPLATPPMVSYISCLLGSERGPRKHRTFWACNAFFLGIYQILLSLDLPNH
jgi:hypothetical protein